MERLSRGVLQTKLGDCRVAVASPEDAEAVLRLRDGLARHLVGLGVRQWQPGEVPLAWVEKRIASGSVYLLRLRDHVVASVTITTDDVLTWGQGDDGLAGYIHMLMVDRAFAGHSLGRALLAWSESKISADGRHLARLDCVRGNERLRRYYEEAGYRLVGYKDHPEISWALGVALYEKRVLER